jgi:hypothetical protein
MLFIRQKDPRCVHGTITGNPTLLQYSRQQVSRSSKSKKPSGHSGTPFFTSSISVAKVVAFSMWLGENTLPRNTWPLCFRLRWDTGRF